MDIIATRAGLAGHDPVYLIGGTQHGNGWTINDTPFASPEDAIAAAESAWNQDHADPDFAHHDDDRRFRWEVTKYSGWDAEAEEYAHAETIWSREADGA